MPATQRAIEDAEKGGYYPYILPYALTEKTLEQKLLEPTFWQAVGKTRGWFIAENWPNAGAPTYLRHWKSFIDFLNDGKTIEEALLALE